ncbi:MAG: hypothetical protein QXG76_00470 [Candidatus Bathyarchaeia archaeon]
MEKRKKLFALLATIIIATAAFTPMLFVTVTAADPTNWYTKVNGVLTSDYYSLYPFTTKSIDFGLSKFGEMINYPVTTGVGVGLQYPGYDSVGTYDQKAGTSRDPFANEYIDPKLWLNGWLIDIRYTHRTYRDRHVLAMAMFADMAAYGGDWLVGHPYPFNLAPHGGRKTTGYAYTEPLTVLYNGPRRYVALSVTHLYDWFDSDQDGVVDHPDETWPIVDVVLTFIFEKVKKHVIIFKDIKQVISGKELDSPLDIQFSNREEWDLGPPPSYGSYAHFFHQQLTTCYGPEWHLAPGIMREWIQEGYNLRQVPVTKDGYGGPIVRGSVRVYVNGTFKEEGTHYNINYTTGDITWLIPIDGNDWITVVYKLWKYELEERLTGVPHYYDVAQIISSDLKYVGWKAFWPTLSDYSVDAWDKSLQPLIWVDDEDMVPAASEPDIPFVVGEWDFTLGKEYPVQFRGVEVVGLTDYHDAKDPQMTGGPRAALDIEVRYQLEEVFNPWDLRDAVEKDTKRWVQFYNVTELDYYLAVEFGIPLYIYLDHTPVLFEPVWEDYHAFSERVLWGGKLKIPLRAVVTPYDYELYVNATTGVGRIWIPASKVPLPGTMIKILYSTETEFAYNVTANPISLAVQSEDKPANNLVYISWSASVGFTDRLGAAHTVSAMGKLNITNIDTTGNYTFSLTGEFNPFAYDFKVFKEDITWLAVWNLALPSANVTVNGNTTEIDPYDLDVNWRIVGPDHEDLHVEYLDVIIAYNFTTVYNTVTGNYTTYITIEIEPYRGDGLIYREYIPGRYEWITVGRDAHSADSIGASLVSAAFKNKQIEIGNAGFDMMFQEYASISIPYLLHKFSGTGTGWPPNYKDTIYRIALRDDWCHTWPIASSNIIGVGGPLANHISEYYNDFTDAFYGLNTTEAPFTPYAPWVSKIIALSCWSKDTYSGSAGVGYAVIATYRDINGTVGFLVWGISARDTFYASQFLHNEIIYELQRFPLCATSIIIEIDYTDPEHPTFTIPEVLGTISEITVEFVKGGIHPDP